MDLASIFSALLDWAWTAVVATVLQVTLFGGMFLALGLLLHKLELGTRSALSALFGHRGVIYTTGWLGVPVHELSHLVMCLAFRHRVNQLSLFKPDWDSGVLGYVSDSYNPRNPYQVLGMFFIGVAPLLAGGAVLIGLVVVLFPLPVTEVLDLFQVPAGTDYTFQYALASFIGPSVGILQVLMDPQNLLRWQLWLFLYIALAVASHMAPSLEDLKIAARGLVLVVLLLLLFNAIALTAGWGIPSEWKDITRYAVACAGFYAMAVSLSLVSYAIVGALALVHRYAGRN